MVPRVGSLKEISSLDLSKAVVVSPSDTIYGFHTRAESTEGQKKIERLKKREGNFIVLVNSFDSAKKMCNISDTQMAVLKKYWPGPITFVLSKHDHGTLALRYPNDPFALDLINAFGAPILSTSCNVHGEPPVKDIEEAKKIFGTEVDLYISGATKASKPSTLVDLTVSPFKILRQGDIQFKEESS